MPGDTVPGQRREGRGRLPPGSPWGPPPSLWLKGMALVLAPLTVSPVPTSDPAGATRDGGGGGARCHQRVSHLTGLGGISRLPQEEGPLPRHDREGQPSPLPSFSLCVYWAATEALLSLTCSLLCSILGQKVHGPPQPRFLRQQRTAPQGLASSIIQYNWDHIHTRSFLRAPRAPGDVNYGVATDVRPSRWITSTRR